MPSRWNAGGCGCACGGGGVSVKCGASCSIPSEPLRVVGTVGAHLFPGEPRCPIDLAMTYDSRRLEYVSVSFAFRGIEPNIRSQGFWATPVFCMPVGFRQILDGVFVSVALIPCRLYLFCHQVVSGNYQWCWVYALVGREVNPALGYSCSGCGPQIYYMETAEAVYPGYGARRLVDLGGQQGVVRSCDPLELGLGAVTVTQP